MARGKSQQRRGNGVMEAAEARIVQAIFLFPLFIAFSIHVDRLLILPTSGSTRGRNHK